MEKTARIFWIGLLMAVFAFMFMPAASQALSVEEIKVATHVVNLEATPVWFKSGQSIDFVVTVKYDGGTQDGFDVGVFHEGRLVGWETNKRFKHGINTFRIHDRNFRGDPGDYIVKIRFRGDVFTEKRFGTRKHQITTYIFTIDPKAQPPAN